MAGIQLALNCYAGSEQAIGLGELIFAIVRIFSMVIFVALVITASAGGKYRDGLSW